MKNISIENLSLHSMYFKMFKQYFNSSINYNVMPFSSHLFEYLPTETKMSLFYHYKIHKFSAIVSFLNCNNFGSNKGIVIKLTVT